MKSLVEALIDKSNISKSRSSEKNYLIVSNWDDYIKYLIKNNIVPDKTYGHVNFGLTGLFDERPCILIHNEKDFNKAVKALKDWKWTEEPDDDLMGNEAEDFDPYETNGFEHCEYFQIPEEFAVNYNTVQELIKKSGRSHRKFVKAFGIERRTLK